MVGPNFAQLQRPARPETMRLLVPTSAREAVDGLCDGATVLVSGFGEAGSPTELLHAVIDQGARDLTVVANNAGNGDVGLAALLAAGRVHRVICSYPRGSHSHVFERLWAQGKIVLELVPQGTLAERIRAGGAGIGGFYTPTAAGTALAKGKEQRRIEGRLHVLEWPIHADMALVKADVADRCGNLLFRKTARNFGPVMCTAARRSVVQARSIVEPGALDPEAIVVPGIYVDRLVLVPDPIDETALLQAAS